MAIAGPTVQVRRAVRDHSFHSLRIGRVVSETREASSFALEVPPELEEAFSYRPGQFCTFRVVVEGQPHLRCYSMSSSPDVDDELRVTVKRVREGVVSNWMIDTLRPGDFIDVTCPAGVFCVGPEDRDLVTYAAGSGITPVYSILKSSLATSSRRVHLLYANREPDAVIFAAELDGLAQSYPDRVRVVHHLDVEEGFVDADAMDRFASTLADADHFICGPEPFMDIVQASLVGGGVEERQIHIERFTPAEPESGRVSSSESPVSSQVTVELQGRSATVAHRPGTTILQTARQMGMYPPFSCESGSCATCMARIVEGAVSMHVNNALTDDEVAEGWVLTCQSVPTTPSVHVVYEEA